MINNDSRASRRTPLTPLYAVIALNVPRRAISLTFSVYRARRIRDTLIGASEKIYTIHATIQFSTRTDGYNVIVYRRTLYYLAHPRTRRVLPLSRGLDANSFESTECVHARIGKGRVSPRKIAHFRRGDPSTHEQIGIRSVSRGGISSLYSATINVNSYAHL